MRDNDRQLGKPMRLYRDTKANIAALGLGAADEGCEAYATDTDEFGTFDGAAWEWYVNLANHKDTHKFGGTDAFVAADLLDGVVRRIRESGGPADLLVGAIPDGWFLKRVGATIIGAVGVSIPGGVDTQVQFNDGGVFGGDAGLTYVKATDTLTVGDLRTKLPIYDARAYPSIQNAIDTAFANGGGEVYCKEGTWDVAVMPIVKPGVVLNGDGPGATIIRATAAMDAVVKASDAFDNRHIGVRNLTLDANGNATRALWLERIQYSEFENLHLINATSWGLAWEGGTVADLSDNNHFEHILLLENGDGLRIAGNATCACTNGIFINVACYSEFGNDQLDISGHSDNNAFYTPRFNEFIVGSVGGISARGNSFFDPWMGEAGVTLNERATFINVHTDANIQIDGAAIDESTLISMGGQSPALWGPVHIFGNNDETPVYIDYKGNIGVGVAPTFAAGIAQALGTRIVLPASTVAAGGIDFGGDVTLYRSAANKLKTDDTLVVGGSTIEIGPDTNLYRSAANKLKTDDTLVVGSGTIEIGADVNLYRSAANQLKTDDSFLAARLGIGSALVAGFGSYFEHNTVPIGVNATGGTDIQRWHTGGVLKSAVQTDGTYWGPSDLRLKKAIENIDGQQALEAVLNLRPVKFEWKRGGQSAGFIGQEMAKIMPLAAPISGEGMYGFASSRLAPYLVAAIKELNRKLEAGKGEQVSIHRERRR